MRLGIRVGENAVLKLMTERFMTNLRRVWLLLVNA
jgi:hypothetical protein